MTIVNYRRPEDNGPQTYAPKRRAPEKPRDHQAGALNALESEIREMVRRDGHVAGPRGNETDLGGAPVADNLNLLIGRVSDASVEEIERVILALQGVGDMLRKEGEQVSREVARYASLNHAVMSAMRVIGESLAQWKTR
jgi:hypothetical protein